MLNDGITRFTIGSYKTVEEATRLKEEVISRGVSDAFITAIQNGDRKMLNEVLK